MKPTRLLGLFALSCLLLPAARAAADFEGTLKWTMRAEVTDPEMKAKMAEAQKQMADPERLAQMKAMLESPQMKAALEQNPQMRAAMEAQIKMAEDAAAGKGGGDMLTAMIPRSMTVRTKAGKSHVSSEGGAMPFEVLALPERQAAYMIDRPSRSYTKLPLEDAEKEAAKADFTVTKKNETRKILGYTCEKYLVEMKKDGTPIQATLWATDDIPGLDSRALAKARFGGQDSAYLAQIDGVPLRMEMKMPQMRLEMEATLVQAGSVPANTFELPAGFTEKALPQTLPVPKPGLEGVKKN